MNADQLLNSEKEEKDEKSKFIVLPRSKRIIVYILILITNMSFFTILGVLPLSVKDIKTYYKLSDVEYGLLNSFIYAGKIIGALLFIFLFKVIKRKLLLLINLFLNCFGIFLMLNTTTKYILYSCFYPIGIANAFVIIYFPIWIDQYGLRKNKAKFLTFLQITIRLGVICGQLMTPILGWKKSLFLEGVIGVSAFIIFSCIDTNYFSDKLYSSLTKEEEIKNSNIPSTFIDINEKDKNREKDKSTFSKIMNKFLSNFLLFTNVIYIIYILARSFLFFPTTILEAWQYDYIENAFGIISKAEKIKYLSPIQVSSQAFGMLLGGIVGDFIGNYGSVKSSFICFCFFTVSCISYQVLPRVNSIKYFCIVEWVSLFFHSGIMPNLTGLIITSVDNNQKPSANSMSSLMSNTLGHMPAPYIYGLLKQKFPQYNRFPMEVCCYFAFIAEVFFGLGCVLKYKNYKREKENIPLDDKNKDKELENL